MRRVVYLAAAAVIAGLGESVGAFAGEREDARAQAWFWSFPEGAPKRLPDGAAKPKRRPADKEAAGPAWFWSSPGKPGRPDGQGGDASAAADKARKLTRLLFFSGVDLWRNGAFAHDGLLWMPAGEGKEGFVVKAMVTDGRYQYRAGSLGNAQVTGWMYGAAVMPGLQFKRYDVSVGLYAGLDYQVHRLSPFDPGNDLQGSHIGVRAAIDLWAEPAPGTMVTASATLSSIGVSYAARIAGGWRVFDRFYLGPEIVAFGAPNYHQYRVGLHLTGLGTRLFDWRFEWQGALGYAVDDDRNDGVYARLGLLWRY